MHRPEGWVGPGPPRLSAGTPSRPCRAQLPSPPARSTAMPPRHTRGLRGPADRHTHTEPQPLAHARWTPTEPPQRGPRRCLPSRPPPPAAPECRAGSQGPLEPGPGVPKTTVSPHSHSTAATRRGQKSQRPEFATLREDACRGDPGQVPQHSEPQFPRLTMSPASAMGVSYGGVPKIDDNVNDSAQNPALNEHVICEEHLRADPALGSWPSRPCLMRSPGELAEAGRRWDTPTLDSPFRLRSVMVRQGVQVDGQDIGVWNPKAVLCWGRGWSPPRKASRVLPGPMGGGVSRSAPWPAGS